MKIDVLSKSVSFIALLAVQVMLPKLAALQPSCAGLAAVMLLRYARWIHELRTTWFPTVRPGAKAREGMGPGKDGASH